MFVLSAEKTISIYPSCAALFGPQIVPLKSAKVLKILLTLFIIDIFPAHRHEIKEVLASVSKFKIPFLIISFHLTFKYFI
jgi:hypothetical protein